MMTVLEYALDVNKKPEEILKLCKELDIKVNNEEDLLTDEDIITLDNNLNELEEQDDIIDDDEIEKDLRIEITQNKAEQKMKKMPSSNKNDKIKYLKEKKNAYKNKEKLSKNDTIETNIILYKEGMTVKELAEQLNVNPTEIIKKLFDLGVMTNLNQTI